MRVSANGRRYASLAALHLGEAMSPLELVEDALRRLTDGSLTFRTREDDHTVAAATTLDGTVHAASWSKALLVMDAELADDGVRRFLQSMSVPA